MIYYMETRLSEMFNKKTFIFFSLVFFSSFIFGQQKNYQVKVSDKTSKNADKANVTFVAKDSKTRDKVSLVMVCIGKVCCTNDKEKGGSVTFLVYKGKYDIMIRAFGYKDSKIKNFRIDPTKNYELEVLIDVAEENLH